MVLHPAGPQAGVTHDRHALDADAKQYHLPSSFSSSDYKARNDERPVSPIRRRVTMLWRRSPAWALPALISLFVVLLTWPATVNTTASAVENASELVARADPPRKDDGFTDAVQWDNYTIFLHGQRTFIQYAGRMLAIPISS